MPGSTKAPDSSFRSQPTLCLPASIFSRAGKFRTRRPSPPSTAIDTIRCSGSVNSIASGGVSLTAFTFGTCASPTPRSVNTCNPSIDPHRSPRSVDSATNLSPRVLTGGNQSHRNPASDRGSCLIRVQSCGPATVGLIPAGPL